MVRHTVQNRLLVFYLSSRSFKKNHNTSEAGYTLSSADPRTKALSAGPARQANLRPARVVFIRWIKKKTHTHAHTQLAGLGKLNDPTQPAHLQFLLLCLYRFRVPTQRCGYFLYSEY